MKFPAASVVVSATGAPDKALSQASTRVHDWSGGTRLGECLRLFNDQMFGQIAWFIPLAVICLVVGLYRRRLAQRTDRALAGYLLWGSWLLVTGLVFSFMSGIVHSYYAVALAPAIAALVGAGFGEASRS